MPKMGYDMREGTVVRWYKREGEAVARGEVIADIETDKATVEFEAYTAGVLQRLVAVEGRPVPVGEAIAVIGEPGEIAAAAMPTAAVETAAGSVAAGVAGDGDTAADDGVEIAAVAAVRADGEVRASPLARRLARERGIELGLVAGSGPGGRVVEKDVLEYAAAAVSGVGDGAAATATAAVGWVLASPLARRLARERGIELGLVAGSGPGGRVIERDVLGYVAPAAVLEEAAVAAESESVDRPAGEVGPVAVERAGEGVAADTDGPAAVAVGVPEEGVAGEPGVLAASGVAAVEMEESVGAVAAAAGDAAALGVAEEGVGPVVGDVAEEVGGTAVDDVADGAATVVAEGDTAVVVADGMEEGTAADADRVGERTAMVGAAAEDGIEERVVGVETAAAGEGTVGVERAVVEAAAAVGETVAEPDGEAVERVAAETALVGTAAVVGEPVEEGADAVEGRVGLSRMRQAIARVTGDSKRDAPHFYVTAEVDMGKAMSLRRDINDALPGESRVSVNDLVVRACAIGLGRHRKFNAFFRGDHLQYNAAVNIGIAITLESGLIVPGISHCEGKSLVEIAAASKDLIARAQRGALRQEEYGDTTFSVSNLGMFDVDSFAAIIFPPHAAVLAVGTVREQPVARDGQLAVGQVMKATLSTDHRVADGAEAAQFLVEVKGLLENPVKLLL